MFVSMKECFPGGTESELLPHPGSQRERELNQLFRPSLVTSKRMYPTEAGYQPPVSPAEQICYILRENPQVSVY